MAHRGAILVLLAASLLTQIACGREQSDATPAVPSTPAAQRVITIGKVSDKPADIIDEYQPLADHLAASIRDFDVGWVQVAGDLETMAQWLSLGKVDIYFDNIFACTIMPCPIITVA